jgi:penicillin-binding protein 2
MSRKYTLIDTRREYLLIRNRIYIAGLIMCLLASILIARIFYLQVVMHDHFTTLSRHNRVKIQPLPPIRGLIFSRDRVLLADNRPSFSLEVIPEQVDDLDDLFRQLGEIIEITDQDIRRFKSELNKRRRFDSVALRFNLSDEEVAGISVNRYLYPGVDVVARLNRYYPLADNVAHVVGYVGMIDEPELKELDTSNYSGTIHIGKLGVEKAYEQLLHGRVGYQQVEVNAMGRVIRVLDRIPPVAGENITLTLDVSLQNLAVAALEENRGAIVAIDPGDGGVLALVSSPGYDPNPFVNGIDPQSYRQLLASSSSPLLNRALQGQYPPGSTIKPFIGLAALVDGTRVPEAETWCPGWYRLPGKERKYRDWKKEGHGHTDLKNAIAQSCDVYFYNLAVDMGIDELSRNLKQFGFGSRTGIDIGGEAAGLVPTKEWKRKVFGQVWYPGETVSVGIGQGSTLVTPVQLATLTAILANRGRVIRPHLLDGLPEPADVEHRYWLPEKEHPVQEAEMQQYWNEIINAMAEVVHGARGSARASGRNAEYRFAGKTGTAQVIGIPDDEQEAKVEVIAAEFRDHALFIAFAPLENPRIALSVIVENGGGGSSTAAPIARRLLDHYLTGKSDTDK